MPRPPRWTACSLPATSPTSTTARRSPRPASAAWPPWTPSAGWTARANDDGPPPPASNAAAASRSGAGAGMTLQVRCLDALADVEPAAWDALHDGRNPFLQHAFLHGLEHCGCLRPDWGWIPRHLTLWDGARLVAAAPGYLKGNSHGEFVFDHAWANAYARQGLDYYPKWLLAVPYSPVTGPRLLARDDDARRALLAAVAGQVAARRLSSAHVNFHTPAEDVLFGQEWLPRLDVQYHWHNRDGWNDFDA